MTDVRVNPAGKLLPAVDIPFRLAWRSSAVRAGAHRSRQGGAGGLFRDHVSLLDHPDPRRIDLRASYRDPFGALRVRRFEQNSSVTVYVLVDVSGSMGVTGRSSKVDLAADLIAVLAASARRTGDSIGVIACDSHVREEFYQRATRARTGEAEMVAGLRNLQPDRRGAEGLIDAAGLIAGQRKLVILISDFHMPAGEMERIFAAFSAHDVVPIHLRDSAEIEGLPQWGLLALRDVETGRRRLIVMRPSLKRAWLRADEARCKALRKIAGRHGRLPLEITDAIDWDRVAGYFAGDGLR